ncbi:unnamed protein product, partial [Brenthis ino]
MNGYDVFSQCLSTAGPAAIGYGAGLWGSRGCGLNSGLSSIGAYGLDGIAGPGAGLLAWDSDYGLSSAAYGGSGSGDVLVLGQLPAAGSTLVGGQVPILGSVCFDGAVPAAGSDVFSQCLSTAGPAAIGYGAGLWGSRGCGLNSGLSSIGAYGLDGIAGPGAGLSAWGSDYGLSSAAYGGSGSGDVLVFGQLPVAGSTLVGGQVPILGSVCFDGAVPAAGSVCIAGSCGCGCNGYVY